MEQNHRYFGMTTSQLGILSGLLVAACLLFGLAGWFGLRGRLGQLSSAPQTAPLSQSTSTPWIIPSSAPTGTPTPIPYETLIPSGWMQFKTGLVEIWLPSEFQPGDPNSFTESPHTGIRELNLTDSSLDSSFPQTLVMVWYEPLTMDSLDDYLDAAVAKLPAEIRVAERRSVTINSTETTRMIFEMRIDNTEVNDLTYIFLDGSTVWYVEYIAQINEFFELLSTFEKSAKTFRIVR